MADTPLRIRLTFTNDTSSLNASVSEATGALVIKMNSGLSETQQNLQRIQRLTGGSGGVFSGITAGVNTAGSAMVKLAATLYSFDRIGSILKGALIDPFVNFTSYILKSTDEFRRFQAQISEVSGSGARARAITDNLISLSRDTPLTSLQTIEGARAGAFIPGLSGQLSSGSTQQVAAQLAEFGRLRSQLALLAPNNSEQSVDIGIREFEAGGSGAGLRRRIGLDPSALAELVGVSLKQLLADPQLKLAGLQAAGNTFVGNAAFQNQNDLYSTAVSKFFDQFTIAANRIGNAGVYDALVARIKGINDLLADSFDISRNPRFGQQAVRIGAAITGIADHLYDALAGAITRLSGNDNPIDSLAEGVTRIFEIAEKATSFLPLAGDIIATFFHDLISSAQGLVQFAQHPTAYVASDAARTATTAGGLALSQQIASPFLAGGSLGDHLPGAAASVISFLQGITSGGASGIPAQLAFRAAASVSGSAPESAPPSTASRQPFDFSGAADSLASLARKYQTERSVRDLLDRQFSGDASRVTVRSLIAPLNQAGGNFDSQNATIELLEQQLGVANQIKAALDTGVLGDHRYTTYDQLLSNAQHDADVAKTAPSQTQLRIDTSRLAFGQNPVSFPTNYEVLAGAVGDKSATKFFADQYDDKTAALKSVQTLPDLLSNGLEGVAADLASKLKDLPAPFAEQLGSSLRDNVAGLADQISDALKLDPDLREKLRNSVANAPLSVQAAIDDATFNAKLKRVTEGVPAQADLPTTAAQLLAIRARTPHETDLDLIATRAQRNGDLAARYDQLQSASAQNPSDVGLKDSLAGTAEEMRQNSQLLAELEHNANDARLAFEKFGESARTSLESHLGDALDAIVQGTGKVGDAFRALAQDVLHSFDQMISHNLIQALIGNAGVAGQGSGGIGPGGFGGILGPLLSGIFRGGRASGGPVSEGLWTVGEAGPELLRLGPGMSGNVIPNHGISDSLGGRSSGSIGVEAMQNTDGIHIHLPEQKTFIVSSPAELWARGYSANQDTVISAVTGNIRKGGAVKKALVRR